MLSWPALQALADNTTPRLMMLSPMSKVLADASYSFLYLMRYFSGAGYELTDEEIDEIKAAVDKLMLEVERPILIGSMYPYPGETPPQGTLKCDGQTYQRVDYPALYEYLAGTALILNADEFETPLFAGRVVSMADNDHEPFVQFGEAAHEMTESELVPHLHSESIVTTSLGTTGEIPVLVDVGGSGDTGYTGGGDAFSIVQPTIAFDWCIVSGFGLNLTLVIQNLFGSAPVDQDFSTGGGDYNAGVLVAFSAPGQVIGVRYFCSTEEYPVDSSDWTVHLWTVEGDLLASAEFPDVFFGWVDVDFDAPFDVEIDTLYVASVHRTDGDYAGINDFYDAAPFINGDIIALQNEAEDLEPNGRWNADGGVQFPNHERSGDNLLVDVRFVANA